MPTQKTCGRCRANLPLEAFARHAGKPDGRQGECRECRKAIVKPKLRSYRAESLLHADNRGLPWSDEDLAVALDRSQKIAISAARLGRTYSEVANARRRKALPLPSKSS